jgi:acyl-CoA thioesterase FadM
MNHFDINSRTAIMNLIFRLLLVIWNAKRSSALTPIELSEVQFRVMPNDLDIFMHMNNGRYLTLMDLGRVDLMVRGGFFHIARQKGWYPVVVTSTIDYKRALKLFERYTLQTRIASWDDRCFYIEQQFIIGDRVAASARVTAMMRSSKGLVTPQEALASIGYTAPSPVEGLRVGTA